MSFFSEFKSFAMRGNVMDMAVGIIIGAAFGKIVSSLVKDVIMPLVGSLIGGVDFSDLKYVIQEAEGEVAEVAVRYGITIQTMIDFLIVALAIFVAIKVMNRLQKQEEEAPKAPPEPSDEVKLLTEIRDALNKS